MEQPRDALSRVLPPLIFGTATFNNQYNKDPYALDTNGLVEQALSHGVRAFDTSPYYGPAEELLGTALSKSFVRKHFPREQYFILTKVGRLSSNNFDYSAEWVRKSVARSLKRLKTDYLDVVYCHDVEFVSPGEVLTAIKELRRIRDEDKTIKYIGISGYPLEVLCSLAEQIRDATGAPLDIVMSYANFTLQNTTLATQGIARLQAAGVDVVPNASPLGMGLLRADGVPEGSAGDWHPAPKALRAAVASAASFTESHGEPLEVIAIRYALEEWISIGEVVGSHGDPASGIPWERESNIQVGGKRLGVSVMGVSKASELQKTLMVWRSILDGMENGQKIASQAGRWKKAHEWSINRRKAVQLLAEGVQDCLGEWVDYAWDSPDAEYLKQKEKRKQQEALPWPTPEASPEPSEPKSLPMR
ncbi:Aldo/keto reductase [Tothia fuscella]|uniref:Aldo/keto reductase n=1 Tax=Tothia fuscella TaxID=1048955 RepID=A0A9P4NP83_9PEZI|nr:Aldo/keto reductase [Tothia fuscella]